MYMKIFFYSEESLWIYFLVTVAPFPLTSLSIGTKSYVTRFSEMKTEKLKLSS